MDQAVVQYKGEPITVSFRDVKQLICPLATDQEVAVFLRTCQSLNLNPFASELYLIKYSERDKASIVIAIDAYLKAAEANPNFEGHEAGIILQDTTGKLELREGAFILDSERNKLAGGWARVYRKDRKRPFYLAVNKNECIKYRKDGTITEFWTEEKQPSMLRKTALKRALVEAFPSLFSGTVATAEFEEIPDGDLPPAYLKDGQPDWSKFWARQSERGINDVTAHALLKVASIKKDLVEKGKTLEEVDAMITKALEAEKIPEEEEELFPKEQKPEIPLIDEELLKGWEIVKGTVKELKLTDRQISRWFEHLNLKVKLADFDQELPPPQITNPILSRFQDSLDFYSREKED